MGTVLPQVQKTARKQVRKDAGRTRNLVVMLDGTGNELGRNLSNVLKLFRVAKKNDEQLVYYDPGVGTIGEPGRWRRIRQNVRKIFGLITGWGLDENVLEAYSWLCRNWREGDRIWLFGFSRGAWTARVLGGLIHTIGLVRPEQLNMCGYAMVAYKRASEKDDLSIAWHFARVSAARRAPIHFVGVWDTVASVIVPRWDRLVPSLETLPYTEQNPSVRAFRHAIAIDERRRMYRAVRWKPGQKFIENPFSRSAKPDQDAVEMWFSGVHSDVGGGYPEDDGGLSKFPLIWMIEEAKAQGLFVDTAMVNHLAWGKDRKGSHHKYVAPDLFARMLMEAGYEVEAIAKNLVASWPNAEQCSFQITFTTLGLEARADLIRSNDDGSVDLFEIKSSTSISGSTGDHVEDAAFQTVVIERSGTPVRDVHIIHVNKEYERHGEVDPHSLLIIASVTDAVR